MTTDHHPHQAEATVPPRLEVVPAPTSWLPHRFLIGIGIFGLIASVAVTALGWRFVSRAGDSIATTLALTADAVSTVEQTIDLAADSVGIAADGMETLDEALTGTDQTLADISVVLAETADAIGSDVPESIDAIRATMPALIQSADLLTTALQALRFVGADFSPEEPPGDSLRRVDSGLADVSSRLRVGSDQLRDVAVDFAGLSGSAGAVAIDLGRLAENLVEADRLLSGYEETADRVAAVVIATTAELDTQRNEARILVVLFGLILALSHLVPLTIGFRALRRQPI